MKDSLISVIVPVYNVEKYLPACLDSLLAQTYPDFELLCVNDGSPDGSQAILEQYAQKDSRVRVFCKENGGVSAARNFGLEQARGTYISFMDADDLVVPQYLERLLEEIKQIGLRNSAEGGLLSACARVYYRIHDAGCEPETQKALLRKARQHRKAIRWLPAHNIWEKGRVATMLYCPHLGGLLWEHARRFQKRMER